MYITNSNPQPRNEGFNPHDLAVQSFAELRHVWQRDPGMRADQLAANIAAAVAWGPVELEVIPAREYPVYAPIARFLTQYGVEVARESVFPAQYRVVLRRAVECPGPFAGHEFLGVTQQVAA